MRFVLVDSRHNFFHWLIVVLTRFFIATIFIPLSLYLTAIGFLFADQTLALSFPVLFERTNYYSTQLPYFLLIKNFVFSQLNHWYQDAPSWWTIVIGIPLIFLGVSIFFSALFTLYYSIVRPIYNRTHCPFCHRPIRIKNNQF